MDYWKSPWILLPIVAAVILAKIVWARAFAAAPATQAVPSDDGPIETLTASDIDRRDELARCVCGEPASDPLPTLSRSRGTFDFFREHFAMPPRYRRVIDLMGPPVLCRSHAHVADAMLARFIHTGVRAVFAEAQAQVAIAAAAFEQENLMSALAASLTEAQKRAVAKRRQTSVVRALSTNGVNGNGTGTAERTADATLQ